MSSLTSGLSTSVSTTSGWTMLALPALAFIEGANILWLVGFLAVGVWLNWTLVARRLRRYTIAAEDSLTVPEFFERRFADDTARCAPSRASSRSSSSSSTSTRA